MKFTVESQKYSFTEKFDEEDINNIKEDYEPHEYKSIQLNVGDLDELNGKHVVYGLFECLVQSDECPLFVMETPMNELKLTFEGE